MYSELEARDTVVIALAQEDEDLESHGRMASSFDPRPPFEIAADIGYKTTQPYERVTAYLIDKDETVRQIFPMIIHARPSWRAILGEIDAINAAD